MSGRAEEAERRLHCVLHPSLSISDPLRVIAVAVAGAETLWIQRLQNFSFSLSPCASPTDMAAEVKKSTRRRASEGVGIL